MKPNILIVDDNKNQTLVLKTHLGLKGYQTKVATSIEEAKGILESKSIALLLSDVHLPDGTGSDLLGASGVMRSIAMSGDTQPEQVAAAKQAGFDAYLIKPFTIEELVNTIEQLFPQT